MQREIWKNYAGIGSRDTSHDILLLMEDIGYFMAQDGWLLRSGGARGADHSFQTGCEAYYNSTKLDEPLSNFQEIYLPWNNFEGLPRDSSKGQYVMSENAKADEIAKYYHPAYDRLSKGVRQLIIRNGYQVLGKDLNYPVNLIICWTPDGSYGGKTTKETGGTGHALRIAYDYNVSVYNLKNQWDFDRLSQWVDYKKNNKSVDELQFV
jgi:hypothetical protein